MTPLFVAFGVPDAVAEELLRWQPAPTPGLRLVRREQLHGTLHYLGEADPEAVAAALSGVACAGFALELSGLGVFRGADGTATLWAGVQESAGLLALHAELARALAPTDFRAESRRYTPHLTLARAAPRIADAVAARFRAASGAFASPSATPVAEFALYASRREGGVPVYERLRSFPLSTGG